MILEVEYYYKLSSRMFTV